MDPDFRREVLDRERIENLFVGKRIMRLDKISQEKCTEKDEQMLIRFI